MGRSHTGKFFVFGGCEGSGKSTQIKRLQAAYPDAVFTREPGGSVYAENIRHTMLKAEGSKQASGFTHLCLALASCEDALRNTVAPALRDNKVVFSDRSALLCSSAYEVFGYQRPDLAEVFDVLRKPCLEIAQPNLFIIFDVDTEVGMARVSKRNHAKGDTNHFDDRGADFHQRVREGYLDFARRFPAQTRVINANLSEEEVFTELQKIIAPMVG
jgi:dTMP kinase